MSHTHTWKPKRSARIISSHVMLDVRGRRLSCLLHTDSNHNKQTNKPQALLRDKFRRHKGLRAQLLATGTKHLIYENGHNDQFWGQCKGKGGKNHLGLLLEKVRLDEKEGLLAVLMWAKAILNPLADKKVCR